jgi:uncharacterized protein
MQYLVTGRDGDDEQALDRRMAVREAHIALGDKLAASGNMLFAVATLDEDGQMNGSAIIVDFESRNELDEWLKIEPYVTGDVWRSVTVEECRVGPSFAGVVAAMRQQ